MQTVQFRAMNTDIFLAAEGHPGRIERGFEAARRIIEDNERRFTRFSAESELSQLNRSAGSWFQASPEMIFVVMLAEAYVNRTHGLFNPAILSDLLRAGYDTSLEIVRARPQLDSAPIFAPQPRLPLDGIQVLPDEKRIYLPPGMRLDLGGIAKGWIAEQAATLLADEASACLVNAGGDMVMIGLPAGETAWQIGIEDPLHPGEALAAIHVPPGAVATSTTTRRTWNQGQKLRHHLIDPRTGEPAESDWLSVTVYSPHADQSEVFAKALLIGGPAEAPAMVGDGEPISYLAIDRAGKIWGTQESLELIYEH